VEINVYNVNDITNEEIKKYIQQHDSFKLTDIKYMSETVRTVEKIIEGSSLKCRVVTDMRAGIAGLGIIPSFITSATAGTGIVGMAAVSSATAILAEAAAVTSVASVVGMGVHRLVTFNPDYEINKDYFGGTLSVVYKK
jgi:hypothetical protein